MPRDMSEIFLTPIGTSPAWYNPGEPTSGYLLEAGGFKVLVDCGAGVISRYLEQWGGQQPVDAIVVSHVHADHVSDLVPLKYGIEYGSLNNWRPQLWLPSGAHDRLRTMVSAWDGPSNFFELAYDVHDYVSGESFDVGPFAVSSHPVPHYIESWSLLFTTGDATFGYSSDLGPDDAAAEFLRDVDLLLCEATLPEVNAEDPDQRGHLTGAEAGAIARAAGAHSLLLTHIPVELGVSSVVAAAREEFGGPVAAAKSLERYPVAQRLAHAV
jgi:ribonuclease BN (tRNA processing enzyme)